MKLQLTQPHFSLTFDDTTAGATLEKLKYESEKLVQPKKAISILGIARHQIDSKFATAALPIISSQ